MTGAECCRISSKSYALSISLSLLKQINVRLTAIKEIAMLEIKGEAAR